MPFNLLKTAPSGIGSFKPEKVINMEQNLILLLILGQILLTIIVYISLGFAKAKAMKLGQVDLERRDNHPDAWPDSVVKINNNIRSQFEVPILFYVLAFILWQLNATDIYAHVASGVFVLSRFGHAYIHTGSNYVPIRRRLFFVGILAIFVLIALCFKAIL